MPERKPKMCAGEMDTELRKVSREILARVQEMEVAIFNGLNCIIAKDYVAAGESLFDAMGPVERERFKDWKPTQPVERTKR